MQHSKAWPHTINIIHKMLISSIAVSLQEKSFIPYIHRNELMRETQINLIVARLITMDQDRTLAT